MSSINTKKTVFYSLIILAVLFLIVTVFSVGIYQGGWSNALTDTFLQIVPLPAAVVEGKVVRISSINQMLRAFQNAVSYQSEFDFSSLQGQESLNQQKTEILNSLIKNKVIEEMAAERGITISEQELDEYYIYLLPQFRVDKDQASNQIRDIFGWSESEFKSKIVKPDLLRARLLISLISESKNTTARSQIEFIKKELNRGADFGFLAGQFSDDNDSKFLEGEIGFFTREQLPPWFREGVLDIEEGETSPIIYSPNGFHIFQVISRGEDSDNFKVQLAHILVEADPLSEMLEDRLSKAKIYIAN